MSVAIKQENVSDYTVIEVLETSEVHTTPQNVGPVQIVSGPKGDTGDMGPQGIQGIRGEKGERGDSGVYVGSGDMPENCNVKVDPNGEGLDIWSEIQNYLDELGVGSSKPDVTLQGTENFTPWFSTAEAGKEGIVFSQTEIVSAWEKVMNNKVINCVLLGSYWLNSGEDPYKIQMSFRRAAAKEREWNGVKLLVLKFLFDGRYVDYDPGNRTLEYVFEVDTENRTAILSNAKSVAIE